LDEAAHRFVAQHSSMKKRIEGTGWRFPAFMEAVFLQPDPEAFCDERALMLM